MHSISDKADVSQVSITPSMIRSCQSARMRYGIYLAEQAEKNRVSEKDNKKRLLIDEISRGEEKKRKLEKNIALNIKVSFFL